MTSKIPVLFSGAAVPWYRAGGAPVPVAAYQAKGAASLAASYVNLANPGTYDLTVTVAPTWDANGWAFTGTQYLKTGITHSLNYTGIAQYANATTTGGVGILFGCGNSGGTQNFYVRLDGDTPRYRFANGTIVNVSGAVATSGNVCVTDRGYYNGADIVSSSITLAAMSREIWIGGNNINSGGTPTLSLSYKGTIIAVSFYASILTPSQVSAVAAAMAAL